MNPKKIPKIPKIQMKSQKSQKSQKNPENPKNPKQIQKIQIIQNKSQKSQKSQKNPNPVRLFEKWFSPRVELLIDLVSPTNHIQIWSLQLFLNSLSIFQNFKRRPPNTHFLNKNQVCKNRRGSNPRILRITEESRRGSVFPL